MSKKQSIQCYNCGDTTHISKFCRKPQRSDRCPRCKNVCLVESAHREWCTNTKFRSVEILAITTVAGGLENAHDEELDTVYQIGMVFKHIRGICLHANGINNSITEEAFVKEAGINISRKNMSNTIRMGFGWVADETKMINIATKMQDGQVLGIMKLVVSAEKVKINKYFDILPTGLVQFNINSIQRWQRSL